MKKWLAIFLAILFALAMIIPAAADTPTPTPTGTPTPSAQPMSVTITIGGNSTTIDSGHIQCKTIEGQLYDITTNAGVSFESKDFTCLGEIVMHWEKYYGGTGWSKGNLQVHVFDETDKFYYDGNWQADNADTKTYYTNGIGISPWVDHPIVGNSGYEITQGGNAESNDGWDGTPIVEYIYVHDSIKAPCDQDLETVSTVDQGTIAATNEAGIPETLTVGLEYELTVSGGPWNDGTTDRYDTAVKIGSATNPPDDDWVSLSDWATTWLGPQCTEGDPLDPTKTKVVFIAKNVDWRIRVNDLTGEFGDNSGGMDFKLDLVQAKTVPHCQDQYLQGIAIQSGTIDAKLSAGVYNHAHPAANPDVWVAGNWIKIVTSGGLWQDGGVPPDHYDIAMQNPDGSWSELSGSTYAACSTTDGNYITAYVQLPSSNGIYLRVNDTGGVWGDNTGSMDYTIYAATYSPFPTPGCAEEFRLGSLIKTVNAPANSQTGISVGELVNGGVTGTGGETDLLYYAIETSGIWYDGTTPETWGGIGTSQNTTTPPTSSDWSNLQTAPGVVCAVPLDPVGHIRVYLPLQLIVNYWVRVQEVGHEPNWTDNSGSLTFLIYKATDLRLPGYNPGPMPGPNICDPYYTKGAAGPTSILYGSNSTGDALPVLTSGKIYAVETTLGPWSNNGTNSYEVAISTDNGASWTNLSAYASALCAESSDGNHILVYFQAEAGRSYKLRVYDPGGNFSDNGGSIDLILYNNVTTTINPWGTCADNYSLTRITVADPNIPVFPNNIGGVKVSNIKPGGTYAIEISQDSYWYAILTPSAHHYDANISTDNGSNWNLFGPGLSWATCVVQTNQATVAYNATYRVYFTAGNGIYQMQLHATSGINLYLGSLNYILYSTTPGTNPNPPNPNPPIVPPWAAECYESYLRPSGFFKDTTFQIPSINFGSLGSITFPSFSVPLPNVDDWISYLEFSVRSYFAWCPEATAALAAIPTTFEYFEPFGTINDTLIAFRILESNINSLQSSGGEGQSYAPYSVVFRTGGGEGPSGWQGILPVLGVDSPWLGGGLKWGGGSSSSGATGGEVITTLPPVGAAPGISTVSQAYDVYCQTIMTPHIGAPASTGLCGALSLAKTAPLIWDLVQLLADVGSVLIFIQYIQRRWIDKGASG